MSIIEEEESFNIIYDDNFEKKEKIDITDNNFSKNKSNHSDRFYNHLVNNQIKFYDNFILYKIENYFSNINLLNKLKELNKKNENILFTNNNYFNFSILNILNVIIISILLVVTSIIFSKSNKDLFLYNWNLKLLIIISLIIIMIFYWIFKLEKNHKMKFMIYIILLFFIILSALIFLINFLTYKYNYWNNLMILIMIFSGSILIIVTFLFLVNKLFVKINGHLYGEILYNSFMIFSFGILINYLISSLSFKILLQILIGFINFYFINFIIFISYKINLKSNNSYTRIIDKLKQKKNYYFFRLNFNQNFMNEIYNSIFALINYFLIIIDLFILINYSFDKLVLLINNSNPFWDNELNLFILNIFIYVLLIIIFALNTVLNDKNILFIIVKIILIIFFTLIFNFQTISANFNNNFVNILNSNEITFYFYITFFFLSLFSLFNKIYMNLLNTIKFGLTFNYSILLLNFAINKNILPLYLILIIIFISYLPIFIILINYIYNFYKKENYKKISKKKNYLKNDFLIIILSYIYDAILIYIITVYISNLSKDSINNLNLICFIYCLKTYILIFIGNILKFKFNYNLKKEKILTNIFNKDKNSKVLFATILIVFMVIYVIMILLFTFFLKIQYSYYLISFYSMYINFIWILYFFYLKNLKLVYKYYSYIFNFTIFFLFTIPFCFSFTFIFDYFSKNNISFTNNYLLLNIYLFLILLTFTLWSLIISLLFNIFLTKLDYENIVQYIMLNLKIDCFIYFISTEIKDLRLIIDNFFKYKNIEEYIKYIQSGELVIWWDTTMELYKKKLLLKENLDLFIKLKKENFKEKKPNCFDKLFCFKKQKPENIIEIEEKTENDNIINNNENLLEVINEKFKKEKVENFKKIEYEEVIEKKFKYKLFGEILKNLLDNNQKLKEFKIKNKMKEIYFGINNYIKNNVSEKENKIEINDKKNKILKLKIKTEDIDKEIVDLNNIIKAKELKIKNKKEEKNNKKNNKNKENINEYNEEYEIKRKQKLELYKKEDQLNELLKIYEEERDFFLYLIFKINASKNNNNSDKKNDYTLNFNDLLNFFKKINLNDFFIKTYKINILEKKDINLKKTFILYCDTKKEKINQSEFNKLKNLESIENNNIKYMGISFDNFKLFLNNISDLFLQKIKKFPQSPFIYLIIQIFSLSKNLNSKFIKEIKNFDFYYYENYIIGNNVESEESESLDNNYILIDNNKTLKDFEEKKIENIKEIEKLKIEIDEIKNDKEKKLNENKYLIEKENKKLNDLFLEENQKKYKYDDLYLNKIIKKIKNNDNENSFDESDDQLYNNFDEENFNNNINKNNGLINNNINNNIENNLIINLDKNNNKNNKNSKDIKIIDLNDKKKDKEKDKENDKKNYKKSDKKNDKKIDKKNDKNKKKLFDRIKDFFINFLSNLGFKNPDYILNLDNLKKYRKEPKNWNKFSIYLAKRIELHKTNFEKIIFKPTILLSINNILFIIARIAKVIKSYLIINNPTYPWFKDTQNIFSQGTPSTLFFNTFEFKFSVAFGYSSFYLLISLLSFNSIKNGSLGWDPKTLKKAKFPHIQFFISIYLTIGEFLLFDIIKIFSSFFTCNSNNNNIYFTKITESFNCLSNYHFIFLYLSFFGLVSFFFFALIFWPNFQFKDKLLDIKFKPYFLIVELFSDSLLIIFENILDIGSKDLNIVLAISFLELILILIKILLLIFLKPCVIKSFNFYQVLIYLWDSFPWIATIILVFIRNSIICIIILCGLILILILYIVYLIFSKLKKNKVQNEKEKNNEYEEKKNISNTEEKNLKIDKQEEEKKNSNTKEENIKIDEKKEEFIESKEKI